jgi:branched-chain amino acid transport system ATP-binding protein
MLSLRAVNTFYGQSQALFDVDLELGEAEVVALMGRNGMGKTTIVRSIFGLTPPSSGSIRFAGRSIEGWSADRIARLGLGLVPEGRQIFRNLTVRENLTAMARPGEWTIERVLDLFPALSARRNHWGYQLSGGEQQMLAIGRALLTNPRLLVLDEATEGLAPLLRAAIWSTLESLKRDRLTLLIIDKDLRTLAKFADRIAIVEKGRIVWEGSGETLVADPALQVRHLGV